MTVNSTHCIMCNKPGGGRSTYGPDGKQAFYCDECYKSKKPPVVCLCGSTRFFQEFADINLRETLAGRIVLSIGCDTHHVDAQYTEDQKRALDRLHKYKIMLADEILVINKDQYIGESTAHEIAFAERCKKPIFYEYQRG